MYVGCSPSYRVKLELSDVESKGHVSVATSDDAGSSNESYEEEYDEEDHLDGELDDMFRRTSTGKRFVENMNTCLRVCSVLSHFEGLASHILWCSNFLGFF